MYAWIKNNKKFFGKKGTKSSLAWELIWFKKILLSKKDIEWLDLNDKSKDEINKISTVDASLCLERKGWRWIKILKSQIKWKCLRCKTIVDMKIFRCKCKISPSPWEPI